jgi:hypothetical protein
MAYSKGILKLSGRNIYTVREKNMKEERSRKVKKKRT